MFNHFRISVLTLLLLVVCTLGASASGNTQRLVSIIDYINGDYAGAVDDERNIINQFEYEEMEEFAGNALKLHNDLVTDATGSRALQESLQELQKKIASKAPPSEIGLLTAEIKQDIINVYNMKPYPDSSPDLKYGMKLYNRNCTSCHGYKGEGDGTLAANLDPPPRNFNDPEISGLMSPYKVYNTLTFGIEGTSMPSFHSLSDKEKWDTAFYVMSLGFPDFDGVSFDIEEKIPEQLSDYKTLANLSNNELRERLQEIKSLDPEKAIRHLRNKSLTVREDDSDSPIVYAREKTDYALALYEKGDYTGALNTSIDAYLEGFERAETDLRIKDEKLTKEIENKLTSFRVGIKDRIPYSELSALNSDIGSSLESASTLLNDKTALSSAVLFTNSFSILLREALEAMLIIAAIIAYLSKTGAVSQIKYIHLGWISAIVAGLVTWFMARTIIQISGASREVIEGVTAITAAAVLFYVSYWLISKIEVEKWKEFIRTKVQTALNKKSVFALAAVSFLAVYREAFETVLFYQALLYQAEGAVSPVVWGVIAAAAVTIALIYIVFKLTVRIPLKYFFSFTSMFLYVLCFILAGKGIHELQQAGVIDITRTQNFPTVEFLGIYPTMETLVPQGIIFIAVLFALFWIVYVTRVRERQEFVKSLTELSGEMETMHHSFDHIKGHILEWRKCDDIDIEAEELEHQIQDVIKHVNDLQDRIGDFYQVVSSKSK